MNESSVGSPHPAAAFAEPVVEVLPDLSPVQKVALDGLNAVLKVIPVVGFVGEAGCGASTVGRTLAAQWGGRVFNARNMVEAAAAAPANATEESIGAEISKWLTQYPLVVLDDTAYFTTPGYNASARPGFVRTVMLRLVMQSMASGARLVIVGLPLESWESARDRFGSQAAVITMDAFRAADYQAVATHIVGAARVHGVDFALLFRHASHLQGHQLRLAFSLLSGRDTLSTDDVIACLGRYVTSSNTRMQEVEAISFAQLPGHEAIVEALNTHIILPMENRELAGRMGLRPKRGVLLHGPAGTGKTSIGRALAHQMQGKFFLIDGSFVSEPPAAFFGKLQHVIREAKDNAPSVLFIDDADVLFRIDHIAGLSRYLLTLLDGLESETSNDVCVMMTAMDVRPIPEALLRSGRVELWLETKVPDLATRARILARWLGSELPQSDAVNLDAVAQITDGFTQADMRRLVADAKILYAADHLQKRPLHDASQYLARAVESLVEVRNNMADSLGDEKLRLKGGKYPINTMAGQCGW